MPSLLHEGVLELVRKQPTFAAVLLDQLLDVEVPEFTDARIADATLNQLVPVEYHADVVVMFASDAPVFGAAAFHAISQLPEEQQEVYLMLIDAALSEGARKAMAMQSGLENLVAKLQAQNRDEARVEEAAKLLLKLLSRRGLVLGETQQQRILECSDLATVERWYDLAFSASSVDEILPGPKAIEMPLEPKKIFAP